MKLHLLFLEFAGIQVSIPKRVLEALKPGNIPADLSLLDVSIPKRVLEALKPKLERRSFKAFK